jgi:hypothetical protein
MAIPPDRLTLLPFPQVWDGTALSLRALVLPRGNPLAALMSGTPGVPDGPAFADGVLRLKARLLPGLDALPLPTSASTDLGLGIAPPPGVRTVFEELEGLFDIDPAIEATTRDPRRAGRQIRKYLTESYRESFAFAGPRTPFAVLDDSYACALRNGCRLRKPPGPPPSSRTVWGRIIAQALRQPRLAERLGLLYHATVTPADATLLEEGGWLWLALDAGSAWLDHAAVRPELVVSYAARIPPLGAAARSLFAPVLFPVAATPPTTGLDEVFAEAALYDDGFAKIVHCAQKTTSDPTGLDTPGASPPIVDTGIQLGWDDEQLLIWTNRQIADPTVETRNAPMGVMGYRIDVREAGGAGWTSLVRARAELSLGAVDLGTFEGELTVEVAPLQLDDEEDGEYWMPAFFTQWRGRSLVTADSVGLRLSGAADADAADLYEPIGADAVQLRYGKTYEFRVRLADISGGGPAPAAEPTHPAPTPVGDCAFRRRVPPEEVRVTGVPANPGDPSPDSITIACPRLGYPAAVFAGVPNAGQALLADLQAIRDAAAGGARGDAPGVPDPDVATVRIDVRVVGLEFDSANIFAGPPPRRHVYTTTRSFPAADPAGTITLDFDYVDTKEIDGLVAPAAGAIPIPTSRDVVVTLTPVCREDPTLGYFGSQQARFGRGTDIQLRRAAADERALFVPDADVRRLRAILLQPDEAETAGVLAMLLALGKRTEAEDDLMQRLGAELGLPAEGLTLVGQPARRTVFGCSAAIPHVLAPDRSAIDFASKTDLAQRWIAVLRLEVARDWTWQGAARPAFQIARDGVVVGTIELPASVNPRIPGSTSAAGLQPDRATTQLVFFDAVDPKPVPPTYPAELTLSYTVTPRFRDAPAQQDAPLTIGIELPMAAPPTQTPKLVAAGLALSPYQRAEDYSETSARTRLLWLEFERPPDNPRDSYFARVLSAAPDPMLTRGREVTTPQEPPLPVDPEPIRVIVPGQSDDRAGMDAMQLLIPTDSPVHFIVPLPPGLTETSRERFGFFVHELRVGHAIGWSTAQARFGPPLRVAGVQHGMPTLFCQAMRTMSGVFAGADFATPVHEGQNLLPPFPATELWFLLYAQVVQLDGADRRNILLGRRRGVFDRRKLERRQEADLYASATWSQTEIEMLLEGMGLAEDSPLSVLAVELLPEVERPADPLGGSLGEVRVLRASPLVKVGTICVEQPCPWPA